MGTTSNYYVGLHKAHTTLCNSLPRESCTKIHMKKLEQEAGEVNYSVENCLMGKEKRRGAIYCIAEVSPASSASSSLESRELHVTAESHLGGRGPVTRVGIAIAVQCATWLPHFRLHAHVRKTHRTAALGLPTKWKYCIVKPPTGADISNTCFPMLRCISTI